MVDCGIDAIMLPLIVLPLFVNHIPDLQVILRLNVAAARYPVQSLRTLVLSVDHPCTCYQTHQDKGSGITAVIDLFSDPFGWLR